MHVEVRDLGQGRYQLWVPGDPGLDLHLLSGHDLRDIAAVTADWASSRAPDRCGDVHGEHTCGVQGAHRNAQSVVYICRACGLIWNAQGEERHLGPGPA
jgi:hypothetical protein